MKIKILIGLVTIIISVSVYLFISPPRVINTYPSNQSQDVPFDSSLIIKFNKPVERKTLNHSINPKAYGQWDFKDSLIGNHLFRTLTFTPAIDFEPDTQYEVKINNVTNIFGIGYSGNSSFSFNTKKNPSDEISYNGFEKENTIEDQPEISLAKEDLSEPEQPKPNVTILDVDLDWQDYSLSCEAASLKMALALKGVYVSEEEIMEEIGYDITPHEGDIWGDPFTAYVGDIDGKMCNTGYGVHWGPVAKAANTWRESEAFSKWNLKDLIREIELGNSIVFWGVLPIDNIHDYSWYTPEGKHIEVFKETHVRLIVGFVGDSGNPSKIIINDPLSGRIYWSTSYFLTNWKKFNYSGVVIR